MADPPPEPPPSHAPSTSTGASDLLGLSEDCPPGSSAHEATEQTPAETMRPSSGGGETSGAATSLPDLSRRPSTVSVTEVFDMGRSSPQFVQRDDMETGDEETAAADDWYSQDDLQANKSLEQGNESLASKTQVPSWASKLGKKAGKLGNAAKNAIVTEAKLLSADAKDLAMGVREGASITIQDTKSLSKQLHRDAKQLSKQSAAGWRGLWAKSSKPGDSELSDRTPAAASTDVGTANSDLLGAAEDSVTMEVSRQPSFSNKDKDEAGAKGLKGVAVVGALKETWSATAEVSSQMWRDLKEAKDEAMTDLRSSMQEIRQGVQKLRPAPGTSEGSKETGEQDLDSNVGEAETVKPSVPATEALDMLLSGALDAEIDDNIPRRGTPTPENRGGFDRRNDEQGPHISSKMAEMARATSNMSAKIWSKTELSIKQALPSMQRVPSGGKEFEQEARVDEERLSQSLSAEPSSLSRSSSKANCEDTSAPNTPRSTRSTDQSEVKKATGADAARRARKFGGKIAKKSREISGSMLKQAGAVASMRTKSGNFSGFAGGDNSKGEEEEGIFEIGSDEEEELFAGEGNSVTGSDVVSPEDGLSLNSPRSDPPAPSAAIADAVSEQESSRKAAPEDPFAGLDVLTASAEESSEKAAPEDPFAGLDVLKASAEEPGLEGMSLDSASPHLTEKTTVVDRTSDSSTMGAAETDLKSSHTLDSSMMSSLVVGSTYATEEPTVDKSSPPQSSANLLGVEAKIADAPSVKAKEPDVGSEDSGVDDFFDDMLAESNAPDPVAISSTSATPDVSDAANTASTSPKGKLDFLAAAEKELEDLFGDD